MHAASCFSRLDDQGGGGLLRFYGYDALNRLTSTDYFDDTLDVSWSYDEVTNGIGRLSTMTDGSGVTEKATISAVILLLCKTIRDGLTHTTSYAYHGADRLVSNHLSQRQGGATISATA